MASRPGSGELLQGVLDAATIGSLAASFAHDANNRLTVLLASLDLLGGPASAREDREAALRLAAGAAHQLAEEVQGLLAASRAHRHPYERIEVASAVRHAIDALDLLAARHVPITHEIPPGLLVEADPGRLELALLHGLRFGHLCGASGIALTARALELQERDPGRPWLRKGRHCVIGLALPGAVPPGPVRQAGATVALAPEAPGPATLEFAALAAVTRSLRGVARAPDDRRDPFTLEIHVPQAP